MKKLILITLTIFLQLSTATADTKNSTDVKDIFVKSQRSIFQDQTAVQNSYTLSLINRIIQYFDLFFLSLSLQIIFFFASL